MGSFSYDTLVNRKKVPGRCQQQRLGWNRPIPSQSYSHHAGHDRGHKAGKIDESSRQPDENMTLGQIFMLDYTLYVHVAWEDMNGFEGPVHRLIDDLDTKFSEHVKITTGRFEVVDDLMFSIHTRMPS